MKAIYSKWTLNYFLSKPKHLVYDTERGNSRFRNVIQELDDGLKVDTYKIKDLKKELVNTKRYEKGTDFATLFDVEG